MSTPSSDAGDESAPTFLAEPPATPDAQRLYDGDIAGLGHVMNVTRLWAHDPAALDGLSALLDEVTRAGSLTLRQRTILVTSCASTLGDSYCSLVWGRRLADNVGPELAARVLRGDDAALDDAERALARWARRLADDPNATTAADVDELRSAGFDDTQIFAITVYAAVRLAFSTVNDALGAVPDRRLAREVPAEIREAVSFGRPIAT